MLLLPRSIFLRESENVLTPKRTLFGLALLLLQLAPGLPAASTNVRVNSIGFLPGLNKRATVFSAAGSNTFTVRRASDSSAAFTGFLSAAAVNSDTGESLRQANFDALTETGTFYVDVASVGSSVNFKVGANVYNPSLRLNMMGFYNQRCGVATSQTYNSETWGHAACHTGDAFMDHYDGSSGVQRDATGGWHDAGDYNKYIINAAAAVAPMLHAWLWHKAKLQDMVLPQGVNAALPDFLEELKWELDWMKKMQFPDGRVSDKVTVWGGFEAYYLMPQDHTDPRYFTTWGTAEIASFTAVMALGARVFQPYDSAYAAGLQAAADLSYAYLQANPGNVTANISGTPQGNYTQSDGDARLWAAAEMWESTGSAAALADIEARMTAMGADKSDSYFDWNNLSNFGTYTYALSARPGRNATLVADVRGDIVQDGNDLTNARNSHGYGRAATSYFWGANGIVARFGYVLDAAYQISGNINHLNALQDQLGWIYGRNYFCRSFVTGDGVDPPLYPHDRESSSDAAISPKPGHLVGGGHPSATSWLDDASRADFNEIAINWDGAMTVALAALVDYYGTPPTATPTISPTFSVTYSPTVTPTPSPSFSASPSFTESPTYSVSPTQSETLTETPTFSITATFTESPTATATATPSPTYSITPTFTAVVVTAAGEPPKVLDLVPVPQPAHRPVLHLAVQLSGPGDGLKLVIYSSAYVQAFTVEAPGAWASGWNRANFPLPGLPPGLYFMQLRAKGGGSTGPPGPIKRLYLLP